MIKDQIGCENQPVGKVQCNCNQQLFGVRLTVRMIKRCRADEQVHAGQIVEEASEEPEGVEMGVELAERNSRPHKITRHHLLL